MLASNHREFHHLPLSRLAEPCIRALPTIWFSSVNTLSLGQRHQPLSDHYGLRHGVGGFGLQLPFGWGFQSFIQLRWVQTPKNCLELRLAAVNSSNSVDFADHMRVRMPRYHHFLAPFSHVVSASYWKCLLAHEIQFLFELRLAVRQAQRSSRA